MNREKHLHLARWPGKFKFHTKSTIDLSNIVSSRSCEGPVLHKVLDYVSDLKKHLVVVEFDAFIEEKEMALETPKASKFLQALFDHHNEHNLMHATLEEMRAAIKRLENIIDEDEDADTQHYCEFLIKKVWYD